MSSVADNSKKLLATLAKQDGDALEALVVKHNALYWDKNEPEIDDPTFDKILEALRKAKPKSPALDALGPTKPKGGGGFATVTHDRVMLSLDKCYDDDTLVKWAAGVKGGFLVSPKIDGLACSLKYAKTGALKQAATRGDGKKGDDITQNASQVKDIPKKLDTDEALEVRGEVYMSLSRFNKHYKGDKSNPRNLAAGAIKTKDPKESAEYGLSFFAYDLIGAGAKTERQKFDFLKKLGFPILPCVFVEVAKDLPDAFKKFVATVKALDTETDGVVIKADLQSEHERLGATAHHPRAAIAYKFQGEGAQTTIREIEWSVARSGAITPVAIVDPIFISGVTVTRVSLHNVGYAKKLGAGVGAGVEVVRRGGVIPHVERVLTKPKELITPPKTWGKEKPKVRMEGDFLYLDDPGMSAEVVADRVRHFAQMVDATGFGEKVLSQGVEAGLLRSPADLYRLTKQKLMGLDRMGDISAQKLVDMMDARRELTLSTFLVALGIDDIGKTVAEQLADEFGSLAKIRKLTEADLDGVHGIGPSIASSIVRGMKHEADVIDGLLKEVKIVEAKKVANTGQVLFGKTVVFTGAMAQLDRKSAQKKVIAAGGKAPSGVSAELDYLVIGDEGSPLLDAAGEKSTKHKAADKLIAKGSKLTIISETDFLKMLA